MWRSDRFEDEGLTGLTFAVPGSLATATSPWVRFKVSTTLHGSYIFSRCALRVTDMTWNWFLQNMQTYLLRCLYWIDIKCIRVFTPWSWTCCSCFFTRLGVGNSIFWRVTEVFFRLVKLQQVQYCMSVPVVIHFGLNKSHLCSLNSHCFWSNPMFCWLDDNFLDSSLFTTRPSLWMNPYCFLWSHDFQPHSIAWFTVFSCLNPQFGAFVLMDTAIA